MQEQMKNLYLTNEELKQMKVLELSSYQRLNKDDFLLLDKKELVTFNGEKCLLDIKKVANHIEEVGYDLLVINETTDITSLLVLINLLEADLPFIGKVFMNQRINRFSLAPVVNNVNLSYFIDKLTEIEIENKKIEEERINKWS